MSVKFTPAPDALYDGGRFRVYGNRIEIDRLGFFGGVKGVDVVYYSDITSVQASRKQLVISRTGWKTNILDFKKTGAGPGSAGHHQHPQALTRSV